jgi:hypothetical protein
VPREEGREWAVCSWQLARKKKGKELAVGNFGKRKKREAKTNKE